MASEGRAGRSTLSEQQPATANGRGERGWRDKEREDEHQQDPDKDRFPEIPPGQIPPQDPSNPNSRAQTDDAARFLDNGIARLDVIKAVKSDRASQAPASDSTARAAAVVTSSRSGRDI